MDFYADILECTCDPKGASRGDQCAHNPSGHCKCKTGVIGFSCDKCDDGFYGFGQDEDSGCKSKLTWKMMLFDKSYFQCF